MGLSSEEILCVVDLALIVSGKVVEIESGYLKHRSGSFRITARNERCVDIHEAVVMEESVYGISRLAPYTERGAECICPCAQMGILPEILSAHLVLLKRISLFHAADYLCLISVHFERLFRAGRDQKLSAHQNGSSYRSIGKDLVIVCGELIGLYNDLQVLKAAAVIYLQESKILALTGRFYPTCDLYGKILFRVESEQFSDLSSLHGHTPLYKHINEFYYQKGYLTIRLLIRLTREMSVDIIVNA